MKTSSSKKHSHSDLEAEFQQKIDSRKEASEHNSKVFNKRQQRKEDRLKEKSTKKPGKKK